MTVPQFPLHTTIPVAEGIYMLKGEGGNIGVLAGEDGVFLIDDQSAVLSDKIIAAIEEISQLTNQEQDVP